MKKHCFALFFLFPFICKSQNVGIGTTNPQQTLDVNGGVKLGAASSNLPGTIRYNAGKFEGGDGTNWKSFDNIPSGVIVLSSTFPNTNLTNAGFSFLTTMKGTINFPSSQSATANSWQPASSGIIARNAAVSVFTGTKVFIWGGYYNNALLNDGALYDPVNDSWLSISNIGAPSTRDGEVIIWTGTEVIIWGGYFYNGSTNVFLNDGARYNPTTNTWTPMNSTSLIGRTGCAASWTGTNFIVWGGYNNSGPLADGARYNVATDTWLSMNNSTNPGARYSFGSAYNSTDLYIWGGFNSSLIATGYRYNYSSDKWLTMSTAGTPPTGKNGPIVKWTGTSLIVWGGANLDYSVNYNTGSVYNPSTSSWSAMTNSTITSSGMYGAMFNNKFYLWGVSGGQYFDVGTNTWANYPTASFVRIDRASPVVCETNYGFISWSGRQYGAVIANLPWYDDGERYFANATSNVAINTPGLQLFYLYSKN